MITSAEYVGVFRAHWRKLLVALVVGAVVGLVAGQLLPAQYTASRLLVVRAQGAQGLTDLSQGSSLAAAQAKALAYLASQPATVHGALDGIGMPREGREDVRASADVPSGTNYVTVTVSSSDEKTSVEAAVALARAAEVASPALASTLAGESTASTAALVVDDVTPTTQQFSAIAGGLPRWVLPGALAAGLPLLLYLLLVLRNALNGTVGESMDLDAVLPFPVLGRVGVRRGGSLEIVRPTDEHHNVLVRSGLLDEAEDTKMVALTKVQGEPDPRLAIGLAQALGDLRRSVLVVDADLASPTLPAGPEAGANSGPGSSGPVGLAAMLAGITSPVGLHAWLDSGADVLPTTREVASTRLLRSEHAGPAFRTLRGRGGTVLLNTAPALSGPDAAAVADLADEVILFATPQTPVEEVVRAAQQFRMGTVSGLVLLADRGSRARRADRGGR